VRAHPLPLERQTSDVVELRQALREFLDDSLHAGDPLGGARAIALREKNRDAFVPGFASFDVLRD